MDPVQEEKTITPDDLLIEAVEELLKKGEPVGNFKSHYALMLACTTIQWGETQKYVKGVLTLNPEKFTKEPLKTRVRILEGYLTDSLSDLYISIREKQR